MGSPIRVTHAQLLWIGIFSGGPGESPGEGLAATRRYALNYAVTRTYLLDGIIDQYRNRHHSVCQF
jgi:hypothetical protein